MSRRGPEPCSRDQNRASSVVVEALTWRLTVPLALIAWPRPTVTWFMLEVTAAEPTAVAVAAGFAVQVAAFSLKAGMFWTFSVVLGRWCLSRCSHRLALMFVAFAGRPLTANDSRICLVALALAPVISWTSEPMALVGWLSRT